jgi:predicted nucleic acid-binding protein
VRRVVEARRAYGLHFFDSLILATAERGHCPLVLSEDFNHGQGYFGVTVLKPFW